LIKGVTERVDFRGKVVIPINIQEAREAIRSLLEKCQVEAIAVNFLSAFANPIHEKLIKQLFEELYPKSEIPVILSSELVTVVGEYARSNTVIMEAFLKATVRSYISKLRARLEEGGFKGPLLLMQSNGGITHERDLVAVSQLASGPCGGVIASKYMADSLGCSTVIATDMGGTSFDVSLLVNGFWRYSPEPVFDRFHITWPTIDVESIGAGGGTICRVDPVTKALLIGPASAGAHPGPVCYDFGGTEPTVTDANLVLGLLNEDYFLGGRMKLKKQKAEQAIREKIAEPLGMKVIEAAAGIYDIVNGRMADLIRKKAISRGISVHDCVLFAFGAAGPVHAAAYASELGVRKLYVFPTSPVFSAFGIAMADVVHTWMTTYRHVMPAEPEALNNTLAEVEERLYSLLEYEGFRREDVEFRRTFYMRYGKQLHELDVRFPTRHYDPGDMRKIMDEFENRYGEVFGSGSGYSAAGIEIVSLSVDAVARVMKPILRSYKKGGPDPSRALKYIKEVYFSDETRRFVKTRIYDFTKLEPGNILEGPCIVEVPTTTVVIPPGKVGQVDMHSNIEISL
jgi:N-methylhydantoinase A